MEQSRLDKLIGLLDAKNSVVRRQAAQQIGDIARLHPSQLNSLLVHLHRYIKSPSWDARVASAVALKEIFRSALPTVNGDDDAREFGEVNFDLRSVLASDFRLLGSEGKEFDVADSGGGSGSFADRQTQRLRLAQQLGFLKPQLNDVADIVTDEDLNYNGTVIPKKDQATADEPTPPKLFKFEVDDASSSVANADAGPKVALFNFVSLLCVDLYDPNWTFRHGAALALKEASSSAQFADLLANRGKSGCSAADILRHVFNVLAADRFNDFVGDHVVAPVRETCAQIVATILASLKGRYHKETSRPVAELVKNVLRICEAFMDASYDPKQWECRHAGLLTVKYVVGAIKNWILQFLDDGGFRDHLFRVFDAAVKNLDDSNDDVVIAAAQALLPLVDTLKSISPGKVQQALEHCWELLNKYISAPSIEVQQSSTFYDSAFNVDTNACEDDSAAEGLFQLLESSSQPLFIDDARLLLLLPFVAHSQFQTRQRLLDVLVASAKNRTLALSDWAWYKLILITFYHSLVDERRETAEKLAAELFPSLIALRSADSLWTMCRPILGQWMACIMVSEQVSLNAMIGNVIGAGATTDKNIYLGGKDILMANDSERDRVVMDSRLRGARLLALACDKLLDASADETADPRQCLFQLASLHLHSNSAYQRSAICMVLCEWRKLDSSGDQCNNRTLFFDSTKSSLEALLIVASSASTALPTVYDEVIFNASEIHAACRDFLSLTADSNGDAHRVTPAVIVSNARAAEEMCLDALEKSIQSKSATVVESELRSRYAQLKELIHRNSSQMDHINTRASLWISCAYIRLGGVPAKFNPIVQPLMNCLKNESNRVLVKEAAACLALLLEITPACASSKIVKNLTVLHSSDPKFTPTLTSRGHEATEAQVLGWEKRFGKETNTIESTASPNVALAARNAGVALKEIVVRFGEKLFQRFSQFYELITTPLVASGDSSDPNILVGIQVLETVYALLPSSIRKIVRESQIPAMCDNLKHPFIAVRHMSSRALVSMAEKDLADVLNSVLAPSLNLLPKESATCNGAKSDVQFGELGAIELIFTLVEKLGVNLVGVIPLLAVPVLAVMSSPEPAIRPVASYTFGQLVKLMPLESDERPLTGLSSELVNLRRVRLDFLHLLSRPEELGRQVTDGGSAKRNEILNSVQINAELRSYQRDGIVWLRFLAEYGLHGILCDDMGLGKTLQTLAALAIGLIDGDAIRRQTSLIICPKTLTSHWLSEIRKFFPDSNLLAFKATSVVDRNTPIDFSSFNVVVTSYDLFRKESICGAAVDAIFGYRWYYCILDEGHVIRNPKTRLFRALTQLKSEHRLILSGTPVQNSVLELWALFEFLMPGYLGTQSQFQARFGKPILLSRDAKASSSEAESGQSALENLHKLVLPFILRRRKCDVLDDLPPKIIQDYPCQLSPLQNQLYEDFSRVIKDKFSSAANSSGASGNRRAAGAFQILLYLRKLCDHPTLVLDEKHPNYSRINEELAQGEFGSDCSSLDDVRLSGKMVALKQLLSECGIGRQVEAEDEDEVQTTVSPHRALIFCQFKAVLSLIARYFDSGVFGQSIGYRRLDGSVPPAQRQSIVDQFNDDPSIDVLLLSTQIGGLGLNLTGADVVIFVDHDWNPANDLQAMDRAHRIGQKRTVNVYRLITNGTLEEKMMRLQQFKTRTADTIIGEDNRSMMSMATDQLLDLLTLDSGGGGAGSDGSTSQKQKKTSRAGVGRRNEKLSESTASATLDLPTLWDQSQYDEAFDYNSFVNGLNS